MQTIPSFNIDRNREVIFVEAIEELKYIYKLEIS